MASIVKSARHRFGLHRRLILLVVTLVFSVAVVTTSYLLPRYADVMRTGLLTKGKAVVRNAALAAQRAAAVMDNLFLHQLINDTVQNDEEIVYGLIMREGRAIVHSDPARANQLLDTPADIFAARAGEVSSQNVVINAEPILEVLAPISVEEKQWGTIRFGLSLKKLNRTIVRGVVVTMVAVLVVMVVGSFLGAFAVRRMVLLPIEALSGGVERITQGQLDRPLLVGGSPEFRGLAQSFSDMNSVLRGRNQTLRKLVRQMVEIISQVTRTTVSVSSGAEVVRGQVDETSSRMEQMLETLQRVDESAVVLRNSSEVSASANLEFATTTKQVDEQVDSMAAKVRDTHEAITQMAFAIQEVSKNLNQLKDFIDETTLNLVKMDASIEQVEENATSTVAHSDKVIQGAQSGAKALKETLVGIEKIRNSTLAINQAMEGLGGMVEKIGDITGFINNVADQTNLLALNTAIAAAQAGKHGRTFTVLADEIRSLAERTGTSTREIVEVVHAIQEEFGAVLKMVREGTEAVERAVGLGKQTADALDKIIDATSKFTRMVKGIADSSTDQAQVAKRVGAAIQRIAATMDQVNQAARKQAEGTERVILIAGQMKDMTDRVHHATGEQALGSANITESVQHTQDAVLQLIQAEKEHNQGVQQVLKTISTIKNVTGTQINSVHQLEEVIDSLNRDLEELQVEVERSKI